MKGGRTADE
jgi:hypothetical protein